MNPEELRLQRTTRRLEEADADENQPRWGTARFDSDTVLVLRVVDAGELLTYEINQDSILVLGRRDLETGDAPGIDLSDYHALDLGVSRRHAQIDVHQGSLRITDLGSVNATFLNGLRLTSHQPRILRDGDEVRLGRLKIQVSFVDRPRSQESQGPTGQTARSAEAPESVDRSTLQEPADRLGKLAQ